MVGEATRLWEQIAKTSMVASGPKVNGVAARKPRSADFDDQMCNRCVIGTSIGILLLGLVAGLGIRLRRR